MNLDKMKCEGSYILIEPHGNEYGLCMGMVYMNNETRKFKMGELVFYHKDDAKVISVNYDESYHIVRWHEIVLRPKAKSMPAVKPDYKFTRMDADF